MSHLTAHWQSHSALSLIALAPALAAAALERGPAMLAPTALAIATALLWRAIFVALRRKPLGWQSLTAALIFVLLLPATVPLWQQGLALSFGLVMGDMIFGARGRGFLSAPVVALAFLIFSFPETGGEISAPPVAIAAAIGGAFLLLTGLLSWRVIASFALSYAALTALTGHPELWQPPSASLALGLVFLIGDPVAGASTNPGRWAYGALAGALTVLLSQVAGGSLAAVVFAAFLASVFAPLIDQAVIWANARKRSHRHG